MANTFLEKVNLVAVRKYKKSKWGYAVKMSLIKIFSSLFGKWLTCTAWPYLIGIMLYFVLYHHPYLETLTKTVIRSRVNTFLEKVMQLWWGSTNIAYEVQVGICSKMSLIKSFWSLFEKWLAHLYWMALSDWHNALFCALSSSILGTFTKLSSEAGQTLSWKTLCSCGEEVQIKHMKYRWGYGVKWVS